MRKKITLSIGGLVVLVLVWALANQLFLRRLWFNLTLWTPGDHTEDFRSFNSITPYNEIKRSGPVSPLLERPDAIADHYEFAGQMKSVQEFLDASGVSGFLVWHDGNVLHEKYSKGNTPQTQWMSFSASKAWVSALVGIALEEGHIASLDDPLTKYAPELENSGFNGATIDHALRMTTGVQWDENDVSLTSDLVRMGFALLREVPLNTWAATLPQAHPPGQRYNYSSIDTQALGAALVGATDMSISAYLESRLWQKMGMESDAYWVTDVAGMEMALSGLNATVRDFARFGILYLNEGNWNGEQLIPAEWVRKTTQLDDTAMPPAPTYPGDRLSWYQWTVPYDGEGDYVAWGTYGQYIYVHPQARVVIVRIGALPDINLEGENDVENYVVLRTIARTLAGSTSTPQPTEEVESTS